MGDEDNDVKVDIHNDEEADKAIDAAFAQNDEVVAVSEPQLDEVLAESGFNVEPGPSSEPESSPGDARHMSFHTSKDPRCFIQIQYRK